MFLKIMQRMQNDDEIGHRGRTQILENDVFHEFHSLSKPEPCLYRYKSTDLFLSTNFSMYM